MLGLNRDDWKELREHTLDELLTLLCLAAALVFEVIGFIGDMSDEETSIPPEFKDRE